MSDPLPNAVKALRDTTTGDELAIGRYTRSRVLASVRQQSRRRVLNFTFGVPLAAILIGSGAWAASGQKLPLFVQRVTGALGLREPPAIESASLPSTQGRAKAATTSPSQSSAAPEGPSLSGPLSEVVAAAPSSLPESPPELPLIEQQAELPVASAVASSSKPVPRDSRLTEQELGLYERAHRAHFVDKDPSAALVAWSDYLRQVPRGRFAVEASYNRALCLVRLGRHVDAKQALLPFARGAFGNYRRLEAAALLEQLSAK